METKEHKFPEWCMFCKSDSVLCDGCSQPAHQKRPTRFIESRKDCIAQSKRNFYHKSNKYPNWCSDCCRKDNFTGICNYCYTPISTKKPSGYHPVESTTQSNSNSYYDAGGISTIEVIRAKLTPEQYKGYCLGNAIKYALRMEHKGSPESDSKKLWDYAEWLSNHYQSEK